VVSRPARRQEDARTAARRAHLQDALMPAEPAASPVCQPGPISAAVLFSQLFPDGVQMTGQLFADLEEWTRLTSKLAAGGNGTTG
jgi:hypothetical protein